MQRDARRGVKLVSALRDGTLVRHDEVKVLGDPEERQLPSHGDLSNPDDRALVKQLEDKMVEAHGHAIIASKFRMAIKEKREKEKRERKEIMTLEVNLDQKLLRPQHVDALMKAAKEYLEQAERPGLLQLQLWLKGNQLGAEGANKLSQYVAQGGKTMGMGLTTLNLKDNGLDDDAKENLRKVAGAYRSMVLLV